MILLSFRFNRNWRLVLSVFAFLLANNTQAEPIGTAITYSGNLHFQSQPADGAFDFQFQLFNTETTGAAVADLVEVDNALVTQGSFTVELDFGSTPFNGEQLWLEISVREGSSIAGYTLLSPRQKLTAAPYAIHLIEKLPPSGEGGVDILFVVDNSSGMAEEQAVLTNSFGAFITALESAAGGTLPNVHIGVISTDMGVGPNNVLGCTSSGDHGALQSIPRGECTAPADAYISDFADTMDTRATNYAGGLADTFACIAELGTDGCGFEQPLEAVRRALNGTIPGNDGFLRNGSALAVIILTDEDDCSTSDTGMFDPSQDDILDPLGPFSSYRCFDFGVICNPDEPRIPGTKNGCISREFSPYMYGVQEYVTFLKSIKPENQLVVATIHGPNTPVSVQLDNGDLLLQPSCVSANGQADPGIRLATFTSQFPNNQVGTVCGGIAAALDQIALDIATALP